MRIGLVVFACVAALAALVPAPADAQSPGCRARYNRAVAAPASRQLAELRAVIANCPRDRVAGQARARIAEINRQQQSSSTQVADRNPQRGERRVTPPPRQTPPPGRQEPPRQPASQARGVIINNTCSYGLELLLFYQTSEGWFNDIWNVGAYEQIELQTAQGTRLRVASDEMNYIAYGPTGPLGTDNSMPYEFEGETLYITPANATVNSSGDYEILLACDSEVAETPPALPPVQQPPPVDPAPAERGITIENQCPYDLQVRLVYMTTQGWWHPNGQYWQLPAGQIIRTIRYDNNAPVMTTSGQIYYHLTGPNGPFAPQNPTYFRYGDVDNFGMTRVDASVESSGNYYVRFFC